MTRGPGQDDGEDVNSLINALRAVAREGEQEIASLPADAAPLLPEAIRARIADQILAAQAREREQLIGVQSSEPQPVENVHGRGQDALSLRREARVRSRKSFVFTVGGLGVAAAAAAIFMIGLRPAGEGGPLPAYAVSASGGVAELRGGKPDVTEAAEVNGATTAPTERLRAESELRVICRPDSTIEGPVAVRAFFVQGGDVDEVTPSVQVAATGAAELRVRGADLVGKHQGHGSLRVVVGRPRAVQAVRMVDARGAAASTGRELDPTGLRWLTVPLELESR